VVVGRNVDATKGFAGSLTVSGTTFDVKLLCHYRREYKEEGGIYGVV